MVMVAALDPGTANLVVCTQTEKGSKVLRMRNSFLEIPKDQFALKMLKQMKVPYYEKGKQLYLVGDEAFEMATTFAKDLRRPMASGVIASGEMEAVPMITRMIEKLLVDSGVEKGAKVAYSCPANPIDTEIDNVFHKSIIEGALRHLGMEPQEVVEAHAVALDALGNDDFTGVAMSFGGGMVNTCVTFRSMPVLSFSSCRSGDWIDAKTAKACGEATSRITALKEHKNTQLDPNTSDRRIAALYAYYQEVIAYTLQNMKDRLENGANLPAFKNPVPIVIAGGTAMVPGFLDLFKRVFATVDFPLEISDIRLVDDPLYAVARGCLVMASM
jgi:hypothetical protein